MVRQTVSTYLTCKLDTSIFLSWLSQTAKACAQEEKEGLLETKTPNPPALEKGPRLKTGHGRKQSRLRHFGAFRGQNGIFICISCEIYVYYCQMAQWIDLVGQEIAAETVGCMPSGVRNALQRAIKARNDFQVGTKGPDLAPMSLWEPSSTPLMF